MVEKVKTKSEEKFMKNEFLLFLILIASILALGTPAKSTDTTNQVLYNTQSPNTDLSLREENASQAIVKMRNFLREGEQVIQL
ncbi:MAG: hypothetical protein AAGA76_12220 [Pseudomonadota bacterium]